MLNTQTKDTNISEHEDKKSQKDENGKETWWARPTGHFLKRIAVRMILIGTFLLGLVDVLCGDRVLEVIKLIGTFWLGAEAGARVPK